jgi:hypothetical protein
LGDWNGYDGWTSMCALGGSLDHFSVFQGLRQTTSRLAFKAGNS